MHNTETLFSSASVEWGTPQDVFDELNNEFHFNLDPCATKENAKCDKFFTKEENGLLQDWGGGSQCFAIHHMEEVLQDAGSRRLLRRQGSQIRQWSC